MSKSWIDWSRKSPPRCLDVLVGRRCPAARGDNDLEDLAGVSATDLIVRLGKPGVVAAVKTHHASRLLRAEVLDTKRSLNKVHADRLFAKNRLAGVRALA